MNELFNSPSEPVRFQPRERGPVFFLRQSVVRDRHRMPAAVAEEATAYNFWDLMAALKAAVDRMEKSGQFDEPFDQWRELLELYEGQVREAAARSLAENSEETQQEFIRLLNEEPPPVTQIGTHAKKWDREFARVKSQADNYALAYGIVAAREFLVGWEGTGFGKFTRDATGASEQSLEKIQNIDFIAIGRRVQQMLEPKPDTVGNSDSPSSSPSSPTISGASKTSRRTSPSNGKTSVVAQEAA